MSEMQKGDFSVKEKAFVKYKKIVDTNFKYKKLQSHF